MSRIYAGSTIKSTGHQDGDDARRNINEEDPVPGPVVGNPPSQEGPDDRPEHDPYSENGHRRTMLRRRKSLEKYGLGYGLKGTAGKALENPEDHEALYAPGETAQQRTQGKKRNGKNEKAFPA